MGLSKSKAPKPGQTGFPNQSGFSTPQMSNQSPFSTGQMPGGGGFPGQFGTATPGFGTNFGQPPAPQGFGGQPGGFTSGFPPFPPQPAQQQLTGFPPSSLFPNTLAPPPPLGPSSAYPVSYQNQSNMPFRPLIPGYAPAPGNDRRGGQDHHHHHQEQAEFSNRFFNDQMHPVPPMGQMHKSRKH